MDTLFDINSQIYSFDTVIINLILSFVLGLLISYVYRKTHKGLSYSQSFIITATLVTVIVAMVIMIIGNNLARAFALVGALSIIRFRTVLKDTKDIAFVFWSLSAGLAAGTSSYFLAIFGSIFISVVCYLLYITNYGSIFKSEFILQFRLNNNSSQDYIDLIKKFTKSSTLLSSEPSPESESIKLVYDIILKDDKNHDNFVINLSKIDSVSEVALVASKNDLDY